MIHYRRIVPSISGQGLAEVIPLAMVVALSPLSIIPAVLVLHSPRPRPTGLAFLAGWVFGLAALTAIAIGVSGRFTGRADGPPHWMAWVRIGVGAVLVGWGVARWLNRNGEHHDMPGTAHLTAAGPGKALLIGAALTVANPKVLLICIAAGMAIGTSAERDAILGTAVVFVVAAASTVALPILAYALSGDRLDPTLDRVKAWMEKHTAALMAAILVIIGLMVLSKGIHGL